MTRNQPRELRRAALYARLSRRTDSNTPNIDTQLKQLRKLAAKHECVVVAEISEVESAFDNIDGRDGFAKLIAMIRNGEIDVVLARDPDRLVRDEIEQVQLKADLRKASVLVITQFGEMDVSTPQGDMLSSITAAVGRYESAVKRQRILAKQRQLALDGKRNGGGGGRRFGYTDDWSALVEPEAQIVREVAANILAGSSYHAEARRLAAAGVCSSRWVDKTGVERGGTTFSSANLATLMTQARISGRREHKGEITADATWPAIITPEQSDRLRALTAGRTRKPAARSYLLTGGLAVCNECGARLIARGRPEGRRYTCSGCKYGNAPAEAIESVVLRQFFDVADQSAIARAAKQLHDPSEAASRLRDIERRQGELADDYYRNQSMPRDTYDRLRDQLVNDHRAAKADFDASTGPDPLDGIDGPMRQAWNDLDLDRRKAILRVFIDRVVLSRASKQGGAGFDHSRVVIVWND